MDDEANEQETGSGLAPGRHVSKKARKNKGLVIVFDADARKDYVTGFHKRKKKRRKLAEKQKQLKERQKRLQERKERRLAMAEALGQAELEDADEEAEEELPQDTNELNEGCFRKGAVVYEDEATSTVVNTYSIELDTDLTDSKTMKPWMALPTEKLSQIHLKHQGAAQKKVGRHSKQRKRRF